LFIISKLIIINIPNFQRSKLILDNANGGAILFSFGSLADTRQMTQEMRSIFLRAFATFPGKNIILLQT